MHVPLLDWFAAETYLNLNIFLPLLPLISLFLKKKKNKNEQRNSKIFSLTPCRHGGMKILKDGVVHSESRAILYLKL